MALQKIEDNPVEEKKPWDRLIIDYRKIAVYGSNGRDIFESKYTEPNRGKKNGNKDDKTSCMSQLEKIISYNFQMIVRRKQKNHLRQIFMIGLIR